MKTDLFKEINTQKTFTESAFDVSITDIQVKDNVVEVYAKAFKDGSQLGFGDKGDVDIERFRFFNPPTKVPTGEIEMIEDPVLNIPVPKLIFEENPEKALETMLLDTIKKVGKKDTSIIEGKIGKTVSTFYPDPSVETSSVDGRTYRNPASESFASIRAGAGTGSDDATAGLNGPNIQSTTTSNQYDILTRAIFIFDTSALGDSDYITSAVFSVTATSVNDSFNQGIGITPATTASSTAVATGDYVNNTSTTRWCDSDIDLGSVNTDGSTYNNFTLNSTGLAGISKTGVTKIALKMTCDIDNSAPTWASATLANVALKHAETAGTTADPKLVVTHFSNLTTLKTLDTTTRANIKTIDTIAIASVKTHI